MVGVHTTGSAVLAYNKLLGSVGLVTFGDVVEMPTFGAF